VLVYDLRTGGWSVDDLGGGMLTAGTWSDTFVCSRSLGSLALVAETPSSYTRADGNFISTTLGTRDIRPFGVAGYGGFSTVVLVGEFRAAAFVNVQISVDGAAPDNFQFAVTAADAPDGSVMLDVTPRIKNGSALRITCSDDGNPSSATPSEGFIMQALFIEHDTIGKTKRLAAARRA